MWLGRAEGKMRDDGGRAPKRGAMNASERVNERAKGRERRAREASEPLEWRD